MKVKASYKHRKKRADALKINPRYESLTQRLPNDALTGFHLSISDLATNYRFISFQMINMKKNSISFYLIQKFQGCFLFHHHLNVITTTRTGV